MDNIYDSPREALRRAYKSETGDEWVEEKRVRDEWWYRYSGGEEQGPYNGETMRAWAEAGYFGEDVEFRDDDGEWGPFRGWAE